MKQWTRALAAGLLLSGVAAAGTDDFQRERREGTPGSAAKDALEGTVAPALQATGWINTRADGLDLASLRGQVVVIDFWGTW